MLNKIKRHWSWLLPALLMAQAAVFFIVGIGKESLWNDEGQSLYIAFSEGFSGALFKSFSETNQPPLYYIILHLWGTLFGLSNTALRLPSAFFLIGCIPLIFQIGKKLNGNWVSFFACQLFIFSPYVISYAQEARPYGLYCFLSLLSFYCLLSILCIPQHTRSYKYLLYGIVLFCMCMSHPYSIFVVAGHGLIGLVFFRKLYWIRTPLLKTWFFTLLCLLPALLAIVSESSHMKTFLRGERDIIDWTPSPGLRELISLPIRLLRGGELYLYAAGREDNFCFIGYRDIVSML